MPLVKIYVVEDRYDETRIVQVSGAVQAALVNRNPSRHQGGPARPPIILQHNLTCDGEQTC
jgi:hypothetical protein